MCTKFLFLTGFLLAFLVTFNPSLFLSLRNWSGTVGFPPPLPQLPASPLPSVSPTLHSPFSPARQDHSAQTRGQGQVAQGTEEVRSSSGIWEQGEAGELGEGLKVRLIVLSS